MKNGKEGEIKGNQPIKKPHLNTEAKWFIKSSKRKVSQIIKIMEADRELEQDL